MAKTTRSKKDKVTGLELTFNGIGKIQSDKVYTSPDSSFLSGLISNGATQGAPPQNWNLEIELSENYMVISQTSSDNGVQFTNRAVLSGRFDYKKGRLSSAVVTGSAEHNFSQGNDPSSSDYINDEWAAIHASPSTAGEKVSNVRDWRSWRQAIGGLKPQEYMSGGKFPEGDLSHIHSYGNGTLFQNGWEANPFAPNLV